MENNYNETYSAPFLPDSPHPEDEFRKAVLNNLENTLDLIKPMPLDELSMERLQTIPFGVYRINQEPSIDFWKEAIKPDNGEIGLIKINETLILSTNHDNFVRYPDIIRVIHGLRMFTYDIHTHPYTQWQAPFPFAQDIQYLDSTVSGKAYIFSPQGLTQYQLPDTLPGKYPSLVKANYWLQAWRDEQIKRIKNEQPGLAQSDYDRIYSHDLFIRFYQTNFRHRIIPWEDTQEINRLLYAKE